MADVKTLPPSVPATATTGTAATDGVTAPGAPELKKLETGLAPIDSGKIKGYIKPAEDADYKTLPGYLAATPEERTRIDTLMKAAPLDRPAMISLLKSRAWTEHPEARAQILTVVEKMPPDCGNVTEFALLCTQEKNGQPKLFDKSSDGKTLLVHLHRMATSPMCEAARKGVKPETAADLLVSIVRDCANPGRISQGNMGSCGPTSIQYVLTQRSPAEYARLSVGLVVDGECKTQGGKRLAIHPPSIEPSHDASRSASDRIFQSSVMAAFDPGVTWDAKANTDKPGNTALETVPGWLRILAIIIFPIALIMRLIPGGGIPADALDELSENILGEGYSHEEFYLVGDLDAERTAVRSRLRELNAMQLLSPDCGVFISVNDFGGGRHWLEVEGIAPGPPESLLCRNPWGPANPPGPKPGDPLGPPAPEGVLWDDPAKGTILMPMNINTENNIETIHVPRKKAGT